MRLGVLSTQPETHNKAAIVLAQIFDPHRCLTPVPWALLGRRYQELVEVPMSDMAATVLSIKGHLAKYENNAVMAAIVCMQGLSPPSSSRVLTDKVPGSIVAPEASAAFLAKGGTNPPLAPIRAH